MRRAVLTPTATSNARRKTRGGMRKYMLASRYIARMEREADNRRVCPLLGLPWSIGLTMRTDRPPSRDTIVELLRQSARPLHARSIAADLHVEQAAYPRFLEVLSDLADAGAILREPGQRFRSRAEAPSGRDREGIVSVHPRGFGFVSSVSSTEDLYISEDRMGGAMHGDVVMARLISRSARGPEGEIVRVVSRANERVPGVLRRRGKAAWLEPDD